MFEINKNSVTTLVFYTGRADVNVRGFNGETPLMAAVTRGQLDAVKLLVKHGEYKN